MIASSIGEGFGVASAVDVEGFGFVWAAASLMGVSPDEGDALTVEGFGRAAASTTMGVSTAEGVATAAIGFGWAVVS
eukprot:scaffold44632_cov85-Cyclotella_meneghiniana.AAC.2